MRKLKIISVLLVVLLLLPAAANAYDKILFVNPVSLVFGVLNAGVEMVKPSGLNPVFGGSLYLYAGGGWSVFGLGVSGGVRKYFKKSGEGFYLGGYGNMGFVQAKYSIGSESSSATSVIIGINGGAGFKANLTERLVIGLEGGIAIYPLGKVSVDIGGISYSLSTYAGISPYGGLEIGYRF